MTDEQAGTLAPLSAEFDAQYQQWCKAVAKVFAKVQKKDVADVPLDIWKKLIKKTYNNIDINPLYTRADEEPSFHRPVPGAFPYARGSKDTTGSYGWGVAETFGPANTNEDVLHALNFGTTHLIIQDVSDADTLAGLLKGVELPYAPLRLSTGASTVAAAEALFPLLDAYPAAAAATLQVDLGAASLTAPYDGSASISLDETIALAKRASEHPGDIRAILVDTVSLSNQGASDVQEIACAVAAGVNYLRALTDAGLKPAQALEQISFRVAITDDQFPEIAKLRVLRSLWARVAEVLGAPEAGSPHIHAVTAPVMFSQRDPWVNMLRSTVATFAAGVGGASDVEVLPFDHAIPGGAEDTTESFRRRIARNTNLLLLEESHLGHVIDPAGGSYWVEYLTERMSDNAWSLFQDIERAGGFSAAGDLVRTTVAETAEKVRSDVARRIKQVTGINEFPNLLENPLPADARHDDPHVLRWAREFEALRNRSDNYLDKHGHRPRIGLIPLGLLAKHNIRTGFATNLLASGGIEALNPGQVIPGTEEFSAAATAAPICIICATDAEYGESGVECVRALKAAGAGTILLAGTEQSFADAAAEDRPDGYVHMKIDAAQVLAELLNTLGA